MFCLSNMRLAALVIALLGFACKPPGPTNLRSAKGVGAANSDANKALPGSDSGTAQGLGSSSASLVDVPYKLQVLFTEDGSDVKVSYVDVQKQVRDHCLSCHGSTQPFNMTDWPYVTRFNDPKLAVQRVLTRIRSNDKPMPPPPAAVLTADQITQWQDWLDQGLLVQPPAAKDQSYLSGVKVKLRYRVVGTEAWTDIDLSWVDGGEFSGVIPQQQPGAKLEGQLVVLGQDGKQIATTSMSPQDTSVPMAAGISSPIGQALAHAVDEKAPVASGVPAASAATEDGFTVTWQPAQDNLAAGSTLAYAVYVAEQAGLTSLADIQAKGRLVQDFKTGTASAVLHQLTPGKFYSVYIAVRDPAGNTGLYQAVTQSTLADGKPPTLLSDALAISELTDTDARLTWTAASDNVTAAASLSYQVFASTQAVLTNAALTQSQGRAAAAPAAAITTLKLTGMAPDTTYYVNVVVFDQIGNAAAYRQASFHTPASNTGVDLPTYAQQCADRLGQIKPFSCLDGQLVPITINGAAIPANLTAAQAANYRFGTTAATQQTCDRPALLGMGDQGRCAPYSRFGRLKSYRVDGTENSDVEAAFSCRHYTARLGAQTWMNVTYDGSVLPAYEDIAFIQHNKVTGETCFFQMLRPDKSAVDGRRVPPPNEAVLPTGTPSYALRAADFWLTPQQVFDVGCNSCHDSDPWIHSPYIDQLKASDGTPLIPAGAAPGETARRYAMLGARLFNKWPKSVAISTTTTSGTNGASCTSCHLIGSLGTCANWLPQSVGTQNAVDLSSTGAAWPLNHWMPPESSGITSLAQFQASGYQRAAALIQTCCSAPTSAGCVTAPIVTPPLPYASK